MIALDKRTQDGLQIHTQGELYLNTMRHNWRITG